MFRLTRSTLLGLLAAAVLPVAAEARQGPSDDMYTRSVARDLQNARETTSAERRERMTMLALENAIEGMEKNPSNPKVWLLAGQAHVLAANYADPARALELYKTADSAFTRAVQLWPEYQEEVMRERSSAWTGGYNAGITAQGSGDRENAILHFERANVIYQGRPEARFYLGQLYHQTGNLELAIERYRGALEILTAPPPSAGQGGAAAGGRGRFGGRGGGQAGMSESERANMTEAAAFNLAQILAAENRLDEAIETYRMLLQRDPGNLIATMNMANALSRLGRTDEAAEIFASMLGNEDLDEYALFNIGMGLYRARMNEEAASAFDRAANRNPYFRDALNGELTARFAIVNELGAQLASAEESEKARLTEEVTAAVLAGLDVANRLLELDPRNRNALLVRQAGNQNLAAFIVENDTEKAQEYYDIYEQATQELDSWTFHMAQIRTGGSDLVARIDGQIQNLKLAQGTPITLRFSFLNAEGGVIGTHDLTVNAAPPPAPEAQPGPEQMTAFQFEYQSTQPIAGWKYEVVE